MGNTVTVVTPVLSDDDTRMRLLSSGNDSEYVRVVDGADNDQDDKAPEPGEVLLNGVPVEAIEGDAQQRATPAWCDAVEPDIAHFNSEQSFTSALLGVWTQCGTETAFCNSDQAGIEIAEQGRWYKLYADADGRLWRGRGWDRRGTWAIIDTSDFNGPGSYQLNLMIDGSGTIISHPVITSDGFTMRIDNNGVCRGHYVKSRPAEESPEAGKSLDGVPVEATDGDAQQRASADLCVAPQADVAQFTSASGFVDGLLGVWTLCGEQSAFCSTEESGLELTADGRWYKLFADADGRLWRGRGWDRRGSFTIIDTSGGSNGAGSYQLNLEIDGSGTVISHPVIASDGRAMRIDNNGVCTGEYVRPGPTGR